MTVREQPRIVLRSSLSDSQIEATENEKQNTNPSMALLILARHSQLRGRRENGFVSISDRCMMLIN